MRVSSKDGLLVAGDADERLQDAGRVGVEVEHIADCAPVLEVEPPGCFEPGDQPPGGRAQQRRLVDRRVGGIVRFLPQRQQLFTPLGPDLRLPNQFLRGVEDDAPDQEKRLALELVVVERRQHRPVEGRMAAGERAEEGPRHSVEERQTQGHRAERIARGPHLATVTPGLQAQRGRRRERVARVPLRGKASQAALATGAYAYS